MEIGTQVGPYRIDGLIGRGGMAEVYKAWHTGLHCYHAMKVLPPQMTFDKSFVERFLEEARTTASFQHPNIATIHAVSDAECPHPYFTMELVEGADLADLIEARGRTSLQAALPILRQIAAALDFAHTRAPRYPIHRDVKPGNILLKDDGHGSYAVKVVDFGIARAQEQDGGKRLTKTGMIVGTPEYMSPEQAGSNAVVDHRSDQYSLAIIAYEMLCGAPPFIGQSETSMIAVIMQQVREAPCPPIELVPNLTKAANAAILKALSKNPSERFDSCAAFLDALSGSVVVKTAQNFPEEAKKKRAFPFAPVALGVLAFMGAGLMVYALSKNRGGEETVQPPPVAPSNVSRTTPPFPANPTFVSVPDLVGKTEAQAREIIKAKSLRADVTTGYSNAFTPQHVMSQQPPVGSQLAKGTPVKICISLGPKHKPLSAAPIPTVSAPADWTTYRDSRLDWSLEYPSGWTPSEKYYEEGNRTRVKFVGPSPYLSIIVDVSPDTSGKTSLEDWQDSDRLFRRKHGDRYSLIGLTENPLGGQPGARWSFTLKKAGEPRLKKIDRGATYDGEGYALLFVAPADEFDRWQSIFDRIYLSFRFNGSTP